MEWFRGSRPIHVQCMTELTTTWDDEKALKYLTRFSLNLSVHPCTSRWERPREMIGWYMSSSLRMNDIHASYIHITSRCWSQWFVRKSFRLLMAWTIKEQSAGCELANNAKPPRSSSAEPGVSRHTGRIFRDVRGLKSRSFSCLCELCISDYRRHEIHGLFAFPKTQVGCAWRLKSFFGWCSPRRCSLNGWDCWGWLWRVIWRKPPFQWLVSGGLESVLKATNDP